MMKEVRSEEWNQLCENISANRHEALVTIEVIQPDGIKTSVAQRVPLQRMALDKSDACNDVMILEAGPPGEKPLAHAITEPIHSVLKHSGDESFNPVRIEAECGTTIDFSTSSARGCAGGIAPDVTPGREHRELQYRRMAGSTSRAQPSIPPERFSSFVKPSPCKS